MNILDIFSGPDPEEAKQQARSAALKAAGLSDRKLLTPEQIRLVDLTQSQMYGAPMTDEERQEQKLLYAKNLVRKGDEQDARDRSVGKHYLNAAHSISESEDPSMVPMLAARTIGNLVKDETGSPIAGLATELLTASPTGTANVLKSTGKSMARIPTSLQEARAMLVAGTAAAEELQAARKLVQEMSAVPRAASVEKAPLVAEGVTQPMVDALSNEARAPMKTGSVTDALAAAEKKASGQKLMKGKAPEPTIEVLPDRRQKAPTVISPIEDQQRKMADAMAGRTETLTPAKPQEARSMEQLTQESAQAKRANAATPVNTPKPSSGKVGDAGTSEFERDLFRKRQQDKALETQRLEQEASKVAPERPVPSDLNTPLEPKVSQEDMAKNIRGEAPVDPVEAGKLPEADKNLVEKKVKKPLNPYVKGAIGSGVVGGGLAAIGAMNSKSDRGKPGEVPPPKKGGEVTPAVTPPNLDAEAADLSKRGLDREAEMKQQAAAQSLRPEGTPEEEALKTKQAALDAVMAEGNALDKQGKGGFWRGVGKFFGDKGPEDFFSYATDTKGYLAREAQKAKEARLAGNIEETTKINQGLSQLKNFQANLIKANNEVISSIRDNDTKRFVAQLRQKNGDNMMAIALKMSTLPDGTVDYSKMPEAIAKLNAAQSYGKMQGVMQGAQGLPLE